MLDVVFWGESKGWTVGFKQLWEYLAQYCYLPRLMDQSVLVEAVQSGVPRADAPFAYATGTNVDGYHTGLVYQMSGQIYFDDQSLLIAPSHIKEPPPPPPKPGTKPLSPIPDGGSTASTVDVVVAVTTIRTPNYNAVLWPCGFRSAACESGNGFDC